MAPAPQRNTQLTLFAEFWATTGVYESWVNSCPLSYASPNAHITALRGDAVSPQILGMGKIINEDALRRALSRMSAEQSKAWLAPRLMGSVQARTEHPAGPGYRHHHQTVVRQKKRR